MVQSLPRRAACALVLVCSVAAACSLTPGVARALTLEEALARARERAADVLRARGRLAEARSAIVSAEVPLHDDPVVEATGGPRYTTGDAWIPQLQVGVEQRVELSGARGARIDAARAGAERALADHREATRQAIAAVGRAFVEALHARDALARAAELRELTASMLATVEARFTAGDVGAIEVRRVRLAAAQANGDEHAARAALAGALGRLRFLLGVSPEAPLELEGSFVDLATAPVAGAADRPELDAIRAAIRESDAEARIADALAVPELGVGLGYQLEEGDHMALLTLSLTLPVLDRGRGARLAADARRDALEAELALREGAIAAEIAAAGAALEALASALDESRRAVADAGELDAMLRRSWEAGETSLTELLIVRAEVQRAIRAHLDRSRDAGLARIALEAALGRAPSPDETAPGELPR